MTSHRPSPPTTNWLWLLATAALLAGGGCADSSSLLSSGPEAVRLTVVDSDVAQFQADVDQLASPAMEGRAPGTDGIELAAALIESRFQSLGLLPAFGKSYRQAFELNRNVDADVVTLNFRERSTGLGDEVAGDAVGEANQVASSLTPRSDVSPLGMSASRRFAGEAVFVGYGVQRKAMGYDSYAGLAADGLRGRVAIMFRWEPMNGAGRSLWVDAGVNAIDGQPWTSSATFTRKVKLAASYGAQAVLIVNPPHREQAGDSLLTPTATPSSAVADVPVLQISTHAFGRLLEAAGRDSARALKAYQDAADRGELLPDTLNGLHLEGQVQLKRVRVTTSNVAAYLPGRGGQEDEWIVIGAHYDHLGRGLVGSREQSHHIHPGADDNASGVAAMLQAAARLIEADTAAQQSMTMVNAARRSVMFVAFSAEEWGMVGSSHFVDRLLQQPEGIQPVVAMINLDMVGRMTGDKMYAFATQSSPGWRSVLRQAAWKVGVNISFDDKPAGMSDHATFIQQQTPAVHLFGGDHGDYHKPSDTADKINARGGAMIAAVTAGAAEALRVGWSLQFAINSSSNDSPTFGPTNAAALPRAFLGVRPDMGWRDAGSRVNAVEPASPAERAGLHAGDVLTTWDGEAITDLRDFFRRMREANVGQQVTLTVDRDGESRSIPVLLASP